MPQKDPFWPEIAEKVYSLDSPFLVFEASSKGDKKKPVSV